MRRRRPGRPGRPGGTGGSTGRADPAGDGRAAPDAGYATVEAALAIPSLLLFAMALAGILAGIATQIRCVDAARLAARATARGEPAADVQKAVAQAAPGSSLHVATEDGLIHVTVTAPVADAPLLRAFTVHADAYEADETTLEGEDPHDDEPEPEPQPGPQSGPTVRAPGSPPTTRTPEQSP